MSEKEEDFGALMERFKALESHALTRFSYDVQIFQGLKMLVLDAIEYGKEIGKNDLRHEAFKAEFSKGHSKDTRQDTRRPSWDFSRLGGQTKTISRANASRENGKLGGRPRKEK